MSPEILTARAQIYAFIRDNCAHYGRGPMPHGMCCVECCAEFVARERKEQPSASKILDELHALGRTVAVHNDYFLGGKRHAFWLLTHSSGKFVKGEGPSDNKALRQCPEAARAP